MNSIECLFHKLPMLNQIDAVFEMSLRVIASYNDKDLASFVISDILQSLQTNYELTDNKIELCNLYFSICLNMLDDKEVFRDCNFYKEVLDELIKEYEPIIQTRYTEFCKDANFNLPITYKSLIKLISRKPYSDEIVGE